MIEGGLEGFVLDQHALAGIQAGVGGSQSLLEPMLALPHVLRARIVAPVGEPKRKIAAVQTLADFDAVQQVVEGGLASRGVGVPQRSIFVNLVLKYIWVDGAGPQAMRGGQRVHFIHVTNAVRQIPKHVQRHRRAHAGPAMDLARIAELLGDGAGGGRLLELAEARTGVGKSPTGQLDLKPVERGVNEFALSIISHVVPGLRITE